MSLPREIRFLQRGWLNCNSILIRGRDGPVIVDTGHPQDADDTVRLVRRAGVDPASLRLIANTHCHLDHHGGNAALQALSGAPVATGTATAEIFAANDRHAMWLDAFGTEVFEKRFTRPLPAEVVWQPGEEVRLGNLNFEVLAAPGHAPDSIALYQPNHRLLISADALLEEDCGVINVAVHGDEALEQAIATIERFRRYDVAVALPGHGAAITDVPASLRAVARRLEGFRRRPERLARHLVRRTLMTILIASPGLRRADLVAGARKARWLEEYAPRCGQDPGQLVENLLAEFAERRLIREEKGTLVSCVPR